MMASLSHSVSGLSWIESIRRKLSGFIEKSTSTSWHLKRYTKTANRSTTHKITLHIQYIRGNRLFLSSSSSCAFFFASLDSCKHMKFSPNQTQSRAFQFKSIESLHIDVKQKKKNKTSKTPDHYWQEAIRLRELLYLYLVRCLIRKWVFMLWSASAATTTTTINSSICNALYRVRTHVAKLRVSIAVDWGDFDVFEAYKWRHIIYYTIRCHCYFARIFFLCAVPFKCNDSSIRFYAVSDDYVLSIANINNGWFFFLVRLVNEFILNAIWSNVIIEWMANVKLNIENNRSICSY